MEEFYKTVRFSHRLVITVSAALLLFAFSPNPTAQYEAALKELKQLRSADLSDYTRYLYQKQELERVLDEPGCGDIEPLRAEQEAALERMISGDLSRLKRNVVVVITPDQNFSSVNEYIGFFDEAHIATYCITPDGVGNSMSKFLKNEKILEQLGGRYAKEIKLGFVGDTFQGSGGIHDRLYTITFAQLAKIGFRTEAGRIDFLKFVEFSDENFDFLSLAAAVVEGQDYVSHYNIALNSGLSLNLTPVDASSWYLKREDYSSAEDALPSIFAVLDEIEENTIDDAIRYLNRKITKEKSHPKIYGVEVDSFYAVLVAPIVVLLLQIFCAAHIAGLRNEILRSGDKSLFPSILFYQGKTNLFFVWATVVILPIVALTGLVYRLSGFGTPQGMISVPIIVSSLLISVLTVSLCCQANKLLHAEKGP